MPKTKRGIPQKHQCKDHLNNIYTNQKEMAKAYEIPYTTYLSRKKRKWPLEDCLKTPKHKSIVHKCQDHTGQQFNSESEMASTWNQTPTTYFNNRKQGMSIQEALTYKGRLTSCKDHTGQEFESEMKMADAWGVNYNTYHHRKKRGKSTKDCLVVTNKKYQDHLGNTYKSLKLMAKAYGLTGTQLTDRLRKNFTLKEALTTPLKNTTYTDHLGNNYSSLETMAAKYNMTSRQLSDRLSSNMPIKKALTQPIKDFTCQDHLGNKYPSTTQMAKQFKIDRKTVEYRLKQGWTTREVFITPTKTTKNQHINDNSLNPLIMIHEYSHTVQLTGDRIFRVTIIAKGEVKYMNEEQIKTYENTLEGDSKWQKSHAKTT